MLVRDPAPAPDRDRSPRDHPVLDQRVGLHRIHCAAMTPAVAQVEDVLELVARLDCSRDFQLGVIKPRNVGVERIVWEADQPIISKLELVQVREVPSRERRVDRARQLLERVRRTNDKDPPRRRIACHPPATEQIDPDPQPCPPHPPAYAEPPATGSSWAAERPVLLTNLSDILRILHCYTPVCQVNQLPSYTDRLGPDRELELNCGWRDAWCRPRRSTCGNGDQAHRRRSVHRRGSDETGLSGAPWSLFKPGDPAAPPPLGRET